jgi:hypothetical protein
VLPPRVASKASARFHPRQIQARHKLDSKRRRLYMSQNPWWLHNKSLASIKRRWWWSVTPIAHLFEIAPLYKSCKTSCHSKIESTALNVSSEPSFRKLLGPTASVSRRSQRASGGRGLVRRISACLIIKQRSPADTLGSHWTRE